MCTFGGEDAEGVAQQNTSGVGPEVEPLARAGGGAVGLEELHEAAQQDHGEEGEEEDLAPQDMGVAAQIFEPDDAARAAIHDEVGPLVDELDVVEGCLREEGGQREHPDEEDAEERERIFPYKSDEKVHLFFFFDAKVRNILYFCKRYDE